MVKRSDDLPYLTRTKGRVYFRRGKAPLVRLPDPSDPDFLTAYTAARRGRPLAPATRTVSGLIRSYGQSSRWTKLAPRTMADYRKVLDYLRDKIGDRNAVAITRPLILEAMEANAHRARFANYLAQVASILCEHAVDLGWREENPVKGIRKLKLKGEGFSPWPAPAIEAYRAAATGNAALVCELCLGTGQRISDVRAMRWSDIDGAGIRLKQGKTGAELWVPFTARLAALLAETPRRGLTILAGHDSRPLSARAVSYAVDVARVASGTKPWTIHGWRANAASWLYEAGCTDAQVQSITGHASAAQARRYGRGARQRLLATAARAVERNSTET